MRRRPRFGVAATLAVAALPVALLARSVRRLEAAGWPHEYVEIEEAGHGGPGWWARALDWLGMRSRGEVGNLATRLTGER